MKKISFILFMVFLGSSIPMIAEETLTINGSSYLNKGEYDALNINGELVFDGLTIKESLIINGSIQGKNLKCKTIKSNGSFDVDGFQAQAVESNGSFMGKNIEIAESSEFNGSLEVINGKLSDIKIASTCSTLIDTEVKGNIHVKKVNKGWNFFGLKSNELSVQVLELKGKSVVTGNVIFEESGEVHLFGGVEVKGKIVNAKVRQRGLAPIGQAS